MGALYVFIGGGFGALVRYLIYLMLPKECYMPYCTLLSNFLGCFIATALFTLFVIKSDVNSFYKTLLITGFCGGLSTLSALSIEVVAYLQDGNYTKAVIYILTSILICIISVILGIALVKKFV